MPMTPCIGAPEQSDSKDNDCNGIIDDNTGLYDDDGDGFAETDNDCTTPIPIFTQPPLSIATASITTAMD